MKRVLLLQLKPPVYQLSKHPIGYRPPYALKYIEALLFNERLPFLRLIDQRITDISLEGIVDTVLKNSVDIIVISVSTLVLEISLQFVRRIRYMFRENVIIIGIGQEVSASADLFREKYNHEFDIVIPGEAEIEALNIIKKLCQGMTREEIKGHYNNINAKNSIIAVSQLDDLPFPRYDLHALLGYRGMYPLKTKRRVIYGHILSSRGCPHNCIFCSQITRESYGSEFRRRSASNIVDEIEYLLKTGANTIHFDDDNFTSSADHVRAVCEEIKRRRMKFPWTIHARVDEVDHALLSLLKDAGCILIRFGIETGSDKILKILQKTKDTESWFDKCKQAVGQARAAGIAVVCLFIVGSPGETKEDLRKSINFAKELSPDIIQIAYFTPFPGSRAHKLIAGDHNNFNSSQLYHYEPSQINLTNMSDCELKEAQGLFYRSLLLNPFFIGRHFLRYFFFYLNNLEVFASLLRITSKIV